MSRSRRSSRCEHNSIIIARRPRRSDLETEEVRFILNKYDLLCLALREPCAERKGNLREGLRYTTNAKFAQHSKSSKRTRRRSMRTRTGTRDCHPSHADSQQPSEHKANLTQGTPFVLWRKAEKRNPPGISGKSINRFAIDIAYVKRKAHTHTHTISIYFMIKS